MQSQSLCNVQCKDIQFFSSLYVFLKIYNYGTIFTLTIICTFRDWEPEVTGKYEGYEKHLALHEARTLIWILYAHMIGCLSLCMNAEGSWKSVSTEGELFWGWTPSQLMTVWRTPLSSHSPTESLLHQYCNALMLLFMYAGDPDDEVFGVFLVPKNVRLFYLQMSSFRTRRNQPSSISVVHCTISLSQPSSQHTIPTVICSYTCLYIAQL